MFTMSFSYQPDNFKNLSGSWTNTKCPPSYFHSRLCFRGIIKFVDALGLTLLSDRVTTRGLSHAGPYFFHSLVLKPTTLLQNSGAISFPVSYRICLENVPFSITSRQGRLHHLIRPQAGNHGWNEL